MSETLYFIRHERDEDGRVVQVYEDARGSIHRITVFPTVDFINHQTKVLAAEEHLYRQRAHTEMAAAELQDVRDIVAARRQQFQRQLNGVTDLRRLPAPRDQRTGG